VSSTCSPSLSLSPEPRKKKSRALLLHTHTAQFQLKLKSQEMVARATFSIALLPNLYKQATNYIVHDGMAGYSPHHLGTAKTWLVYLYLLLEHGIHHLLPTIVLGMAYCHTSCSVQGWTAELTMYLPLTAMEDQQIMSNKSHQKKED
jgi:hypothetical protein